MHIESKFDSANSIEAFEGSILEAAEALAADRTTKHLPTLVALILFIANIAISYAKTMAAIGTFNLNTTIFVNIEAHSIAFAALFFWVIPAVFLGSVIGVSQTEVRISRILERLHDDLRRKLPEVQEDEFQTEVIQGEAIDESQTTFIHGEATDDEISNLQKYVRDETTRIYNGGIYTWRQSRWQYEDTLELMTAQQRNDSRQPPEMSEKIGDQSSQASWKQYLTSPYVLPYVVVMVAFASGAAVSFRVPPHGVDCRVACQLGMLGFWLLSAGADKLVKWWLPIKPENQGKVIVITYLKDMVSIMGTLGLMFFIVFGFLNKCFCWTWANWSRIPLVLPQREDINTTLQDSLKAKYPAFVFTGLAIECFVVPAWICFRYYDALRVFVQRDDGMLNWESWHTIQNLFRRTHKRVSTDPRSGQE